jgi:hypothetical protein
VEGDDARADRARGIAEDVGQLHPADARADRGQVLLHRALDEGEGHSDEEGGRRDHQHGQQHDRQQPLAAQALHVGRDLRADRREGQRPVEPEDQHDREREAARLGEEEGGRGSRIRRTIRAATAMPSPSASRKTPSTVGKR